MRSTAIVIISVLALAGCGTRPTERALSGAGVGALVGTAATAVVGAPLLTGALIGAGTGAVVGAVTSPDTINLGRPVWKQ